MEAMITMAAKITLRIIGVMVWARAWLTRRPRERAEEVSARWMAVSAKIHTSQASNTVKAIARIAWPMRTLATPSRPMPTSEPPHTCSDSSANTSQASTCPRV